LAVVALIVLGSRCLAVPSELYVRRWTKGESGRSEHLTRRDGRLPKSCGDSDTEQPAAINQMAGTSLRGVVGQPHVLQRRKFSFSVFSDKWPASKYNRLDPAQLLSEMTAVATRLNRNTGLSEILN
jgi:hypothetical protein